MLRVPHYFIHASGYFNSGMDVMDEDDGLRDVAEDSGARAENHVHKPFFLSKDFSDVEIVVGEHVLPAHQLVLAASSPVLK